MKQLNTPNNKHHNLHDEDNKWFNDNYKKSETVDIMIGLHLL